MGRCDHGPVRCSGHAVGDPVSTAANGKIALWNAFGTLDLIAAVALGVVSANGSPLQLIHAGAGSAAVLLLPWSLIPTVLVPFYLITHGIVFAQLRARRIGAALGRRFELRMTPSAIGSPPRRVFELSHGDGILARRLEEAVFLALGHDKSIGRS